MNIFSQKSFTPNVIFIKKVPQNHLIIMYIYTQRNITIRDKQLIIIQTFLNFFIMLTIWISFSYVV